MRVDITTGLLGGVRQSYSPNCDARPGVCDPELLVVHGISLPPGEYGGPWIGQFFANTLDADAHPYFAEIAHLRVSAHVLIRRDGSLVQFVPFTLRAWHAGMSSYRGREACNDFSVGVELEGVDDSDYAAAQYVALARLYAALADAWPAIARNPVLGHSDIAPGRKTDPGPAFDWLRLARLAAGLGRPLSTRSRHV